MYAKWIYNKNSTLDIKVEHSAIVMCKILTDFKEELSKNNAPPINLSHGTSKTKRVAAVFGSGEI